MKMRTFSKYICSARPYFGIMKKDGEVFDIMTRTFIEAMQQILEHAPPSMKDQTAHPGEVIIFLCPKRSKEVGARKSMSLLA